jgi:DNA-binding response OmpR family regulator
MTDICILIADNDSDTLKNYHEYLTSLGYKVLTASSVAEAREILATRRVHLALLDLRLTDDTEGDRSGLLLAVESNRSVPKIIFTKWPSYPDAREGMKMDDGRLPPVIDFLDKKVGLKKVGEAIEQAVERHVRINRRLVIQHAEALPQLASLFAPEANSLQWDAEELEDLFRRLFYETDQIKLDRVLWQQPGRVALKVYTFAEGQSPGVFIVVCGHRARVAEEASRYRKFAPKAVGHSGTALSNTSETQRYAANTYALAHTDPENTHTLFELYTSHGPRDFNAAVAHLLEKTLVEWHQEKYLPNDGKTLVELYAERLRGDGELIAHGELTAHLRALVRLVPMLNVEARYDAKGLAIRFAGQEYSYPDPVPLLGQLGRTLVPASLMTTPGLLSGENILTDLEGRTWLTDFHAAGPAPQLWNFTALEAAIRFDWAATKKLQWLHDMEQYLAGDEFNLKDLSNVEQPLRKPVRAIRHIRELGARTIIRHHPQYHFEILLHALHRLKGFDAAQRLTHNELVRFAHLLIAVAMICQRLKTADQGRVTRSEVRPKGVHVDENAKAVTVDGLRVPLSGQGYSLLSYMFAHLNEVCPRQALVERGMFESYDRNDRHQVARLNTAIRRLREDIEPDADHPKYIIMERGGGYRLVGEPTPK